MPRDARAYLADIVEACDAIAEYVQNAELSTYRANKMLRDAVERRIFIVGEAVSQLRKLEPLEVHTLGTVHRIVTVRNILGHAYFAVDDDVVWEIAVGHVPKLRAAAVAWIDLLNRPKP